ncbi:MAG: carboxylesterase family protein, partial [Spongiibacteraceae bacterium]
VYHYDRQDSNSMFKQMAPGFTEDQYRGLHCGQSGYSSGNVRSMNDNPSPEDLKLSEVLSSYWFNFASTGNPNGPGLPQWPSYDATPDAEVLLINNDGVKLSPLPSMSRMLVLDRIYDSRHKRPAKSAVKN